MPIRFLSLLLGLSLAALTCGEVNAQPVPTDEQLWAEADARIERHRKADVALVVMDAHNRPVAGADVRVEQTRHAFLFGCNLFRWGRVGDEKHEAEYRRRFADVFNFATLPFYWWTYERERDKPIHERTADMARWCRQQGILCKGHPLAWNYGEPRWLPDDPQETRRLQMARIDDCVRRFQGLIDIWDVVNEPTHFDRPHCRQRAPKLTAVWAGMGKVEFTRECFRHARPANSSATLLINDYRVDAAYADVIRQLVDDNGKPMYDVIGIQSHQHGGTWTNRKIYQTCERFAQFGVPLHFTETTIVSGKQGWQLRDRGVQWDTTPEGEAIQAREVTRFYTMLYSHPAVEAITWWDFSDHGAWQGAPAGFLRKDMSPKPAYKALRKLIKEEWWTKTTTKTDDNGASGFRGSLGDYRITVRTPDGKSQTQNIAVTRGEQNRFTLQIK
jgi:GH35 family endo-1,4-beta-xylanase